MAATITTYFPRFWREKRGKSGGGKPEPVLHTCRATRHAPELKPETRAAAARGGQTKPNYGGKTARLADIGCSGRLAFP